MLCRRLLGSWVGRHDVSCVMSVYFFGIVAGKGGYGNKNGRMMGYA